VEIVDYSLQTALLSGISVKNLNQLNRGADCAISCRTRIDCFSRRLRLRAYPLNVSISFNSVTDRINATGWTSIRVIHIYHSLRREELCRLKIKDIHPRRGVPHLRVHGKGNKTRYIPLHAGTQELLNDYLDEARHAADTEGALFRPVRNNRSGELDNTITPDGVYKLVRRYALALGLKIGAHAFRATAATNALDHEADIAKVPE
jgi:integrase